MLLYQVLLVSVLVILSRSSTKENTTLLLVQTLFRHGDRAPIQLYPTDPNSADYWFNGLGELTQRGKKQQYVVGKFLRSFYKDFVTSDPKEIYVNSSSEDRCLNSVESNLASFYAPTKKWKLERHLNWQPIPIHYLPKDLDTHLNAKSSCQRYTDEIMNSFYCKETIQEFYQTHQTMVEVISNSSGIDFSNPLEAFLLYDTLYVEKVSNLFIPEWANMYLNEMAFLSYKIFQENYNSAFKLQLLIGPFLEEFRDKMLNKINGKCSDIKFRINSAHDTHVAAVLYAFNFTDMPRPPYCPTLLFELHAMADTLKAVRLLYMNSTDPLQQLMEPHVLVLDGCSEYCPM